MSTQSTKKTVLSGMSGVFVLLVGVLLAPAAALAAPTPQQLATVEVICDTRLGTGAFTSLNDGGYVLTVGHVPINTGTGATASDCQVGFIADDTLTPLTYFKATVVHAVFDEGSNRDFAVLKIGERISGNGGVPSQPIKSNEFANVGDPITAAGFPEGSTRMKMTSGVIKNFRRGSIVTDMVITQGYSGAPTFDANGNMVGLAERVNYVTDPSTNRETIIDYQLSDILAFINWLDTFGPNEHDRYITHADPARFDDAPYVIRTESSGCDYLVRTQDSSSVFCLLNGPYRLVFPDEHTFFSWYPDFSGVHDIAGSDVAQYQLAGNVRMRAGTLVKITTDPSVYLVIDSLGTLRKIPSEDRAQQLFGNDWAKLVRDVPDEFFSSYFIGAPIR